MAGACLALNVISVQAFEPSKIFTDHMVLQQGKELPVWGFADDGTEISVTFNKTTKKASTKDGKWMVRFPKMDYGKNHEMKISDGESEVLLKNIAIGEVWIASGQSNMAFMVKTSIQVEDALKLPANPDIRLFKSGHNSDPTETLQQFAHTQGWVPATPDVVKRYSAVAYYFARELQKNKGVTIGMIQASVGGTAAEVWISEKNCPPGYAAPKNKRGISKGPGFHHKAMINPIIPFACRGFIWYQGESNAGNAGEYETTFSTLIKDWRASWDEELPFLFVQLANYQARSEDLFDGPWARLREAQFNTLKLPHTGMATAIDLGNPKDIHPKNKFDVGYRLSLVADALVYGNKETVYSGPVFKKQKIQNEKIMLTFDHLGDGLTVKGDKGGKLEGFAIAGEDKKWQWADAQIKGDTVMLSNTSISKPLYVRYGFANDPTLSLYNKNGLPALPFRTDP